MDVDGLVFLSIPIVGIIAGVGSSIFNRWTRHQQEMVRLKAMSGGTLNQAQSSELEAFRAEMANFRDTVTQYDMSVEKTMSEIKRRLDHLEGERVDRSYHSDIPLEPTAEPVVQQLGKSGQG